MRLIMTVRLELRSDVEAQLAAQSEEFQFVVGDPAPQGALGDVEDGSYFFKGEQALGFFQ